MKTKKILSVFLFLGLALILIIVTRPVLAQTTLPQGGSSFETATSLSPGNYQGGALAAETSIFYRLQGKAGQEIRVKAEFVPTDSDVDTILYDANKEQLANMKGSIHKDTVLWLPNSEKNTYSYYLEVRNEGWTGDVESFSLQISLNNRYDANSQTDAGDTFDKALAIVAGNYQGYFSESYMITDYGNDFKDFYKVSLKRGEKLDLTISPPTKLKMKLELYDEKGGLIAEKEGTGEGVIIKESYEALTDSNIYFVLIPYSSPATNPQTQAYGFTAAVISPPPPSEKPEVGGILPVEEPGTQLPPGAQLPPETPIEEEIAPEEIPEIIPGVMLPGMIEKLPYQPGFSPWYSLLMIVFYVYFALCLQMIAKKTGTPNGWLAWIPIANIFLFIQVAQKPLWWFILILIPLVNIVVGIILWMKVAERRGKPSWLGILVIVPVVGIIIPGYLAFSNSSKTEITPPYTPTGTQEAYKPTVGYKHSCKYCGKLIPPNSSVCPLCGKVNPLGPFRCPKCHEPIEKDWKVCSKCNQNLRIVCPYCGKITFFGDHCEDCGARLLVKCPHCGQEQPPISDNCIKCNKPLERSTNK